MADLIAREVFGLVFETSTEAVFIVDRTTGRVVSANVRAAELLGRPHGALIGTTLDELTAEDRELGAPGHYEDVALDGGDDGPVYVELHVTHVEIPGHGALAAYAARDTSEHRLLQHELIAKHSALFTAHAELERAHAQLSATKRELERRNQEIAMLAWRAAMAELVAGIAHHLNNPVGALASTLRRLASTVANVPGDHRGELPHLLARAGRIARRIETTVGAIVEASQAAARGGAGRELPPELAAVLSRFTETLEDLPTKDPP
ncbi:MAG TPA: PAS domain-containing protein [Kofleriaceae bacterium]|nr:PAS domain-containing protein [Kofleriaceae bacterium]